MGLLIGIILGKWSFPNTASVVLAVNSINLLIDSIHSFFMLAFANSLLIESVEFMLIKAADFQRINSYKASQKGRIFDKGKEL